jgi:hypothetical protein
MPLQFALRKAQTLIFDDQFHFFWREAQFEILVRVLRRRAVREFLFAIPHCEEKKVMRIAKAAHIHFLIRE